MTRSRFPVYLYPLEDDGRTSQETPHMMLFNPHESWRQTKLRFAQRCFPSLSFSESDESIQVYLAPHHINVEQDGQEHAHVYLSRDCSLHVQRRVLTKVEPIHEVLDILKHQPKPIVHQLLAQKEKVDAFTRRLESDQVFGLVMLEPDPANVDEDAQYTVRIPNAFVDTRGRPRVQYRVTPDAKAECTLCPRPSLLCPPPSADLATIQTHSTTRWHKRYLARCVYSAPCLNISLNLVHAFETQAAKERLQVMSKHSSLVLKSSRSALEFGYRKGSPHPQKTNRNSSVSLAEKSDKALALEAKASRRIQTWLWKQIVARKHKAKRLSPAQLWIKTVMELCGHCRGATAPCGVHQDLV